MLYSNDPIMRLEQMERERAHEQWKREQDEIAHRRCQAYENYMYYSKSPEEKAINHAIWKNT